ncbi:MAG: protein kinase, partial [Myxococcota bacterium]
MKVADLGQGGMADVQLAVASGPEGFNKLLVLKSLRTGLAYDDGFISMLMGEARLSARLNHRNIVQTYDVVLRGNNPVIVMEFLEGCTLHRLRRRSAQLEEKNGRESAFTLEHSLRVICEVLAGLQYAHDLRDYDGTPLQLVHRDVTPANIFLTFDGQVKILDFGIAKASRFLEQTRTGTIKGTPRYMCPEALEGKELDRRADIYTVGVVLWETITKRRMWGRDINDAAVIHKVTTGQIEPPRSVCETVAPELDTICRKALAFRAEDRYATALDMLHDIEDFLSHRPGVSARRSGQLVQAMFGEERDARIAAADAFVHPSRHEGMPTAVLEAGSLGRPVIVTPGTNLD